LNDDRRDIIDATFKIDVEGGCTGTLINRNTTDADVGFYFIIARHCLFTNGNVINFDVPHQLMFNYQSKDANSESTAISNRGKIEAQSTADDDPTDANYEYFHESKIELINWEFWGDFALCKIVTPLPPHFNYSYAGWNPSMFINNGIPDGDILSCIVNPTMYVGIHHPKQDIKKISGTQNVMALETPIATGCYTITTIIDVLFGWIWGHSFSTQVICNYVDNPWYMVPFWCYGVTEEGSSGSGLFNSSNKLIGTLSGGFTLCYFPVATEFYGKFKNNYFNQSVKNILNPSNNLGIDLVGMGSRKVSCYENLDLPGVDGVSGEYYAASHYQSENKIVLQAAGDINVNNRITIHPGADYEFKYGNQFTVAPGKEIEIKPGATFAVTQATCNPNRLASPDAYIYELRDRLSQIVLPGKTLANQSVTNHLVHVSPNPADNTVSISLTSSGEYLCRFLDAYSRVLQSSFISSPHTQIDISQLTAGFYWVQISDNQGKVVDRQKLIVQ
jgi:hypothetical protein